MLRNFAPGCDADQVKELFGPVARIMVEDETDTAIQVFRPGGQKVIAATVPLTTEAGFVHSLSERTFPNLVRDWPELLLYHRVLTAKHDASSRAVVHL